MVLAAFAGAAMGLVLGTLVDVRRINIVFALGNTTHWQLADGSGAEILNYLNDRRGCHGVPSQLWK
jgi:hypothetical protein